VTCGTVESITMRAAWACKLVMRLVIDWHLNKTVDEKVVSVTKNEVFVRRYYEVSLICPVIKRLPFIQNEYSSSMLHVLLDIWRLSNKLHETYVWRNLGTLNYELFEGRSSPFNTTLCHLVKIYWLSLEFPVSLF
jgi:hypothetical protein